MKILRAEHLVQTYDGSNGRIYALNDVSFSVESGEIVAVIGESGSGKSTLFHILGTVDRPTSGTVYINDQDVYAQNAERLAVFRRRDVGIIYQFNNLLPLLTVRENILLPAYLDGKKPNMAYYRELLEILDLTGREDAFPEELSGGQQQRVAIGRTLINKPSIVLADEPTGNLDMRNTQQIMNLFKLCNSRFEQTILLITHDENIALQADRILTLENGRLVQDKRIR